MSGLVYTCDYCGRSGDVQEGMLQVRDQPKQPHKEWFSCPDCSMTVHPTAKDKEPTAADVLARLDALEQRLEAALSYANVRIPMLVDARYIIGALVGKGTLIYPTEEVAPMAEQWLSWYELHMGGMPIKIDATAGSSIGEGEIEY